jgi:hypothetical protein
MRSVKRSVGLGGDGAIVESGFEFEDRGDGTGVDNCDGDNDDSPVGIGIGRGGGGDEEKEEVATRAPVGRLSTDEGILGDAAGEGDVRCLQGRMGRCPMCTRPTFGEMGVMFDGSGGFRYVAEIGSIPSHPFPGSVSSYPF